MQWTSDLRGVFGDALPAQGISSIAHPLCFEGTASKPLARRLRQSAPEAESLDSRSALTNPTVEVCRTLEILQLLPHSHHAQEGGSMKAASWPPSC